MKAYESSLLGVLGSPNTQLTIPSYQRRYSWHQRQCEELWLDIHRAARRNVGHFSGTVLYERTETDSGDVVLSIVDGQQRMTTVSLMLVAFRNYLEGMQGDQGSLGQGSLDQQDRLPSPAEITATYLVLSPGASSDVSADASADTALKFSPSRLDINSMEKAVSGAAPDDIPSGNIARNLAYFGSLMASPDFDPCLFMHGLANLRVVMAELDEDDDPQAVFESLNSKGLQLNIGDMVRNYLLASETHDEQARLYIEYWTVIEGVFDPDPGSLKLDTMIKAWLSVRFTKVRARTPEDVYSAFKRYYDDEYAGELEPVLVELRSFAMVWAENYRYHAVKKFRSMPWATNGAQTLTSGYELKKADNEEYAERVRQELRAMGREL